MKYLIFLLFVNTINAKVLERSEGQYTILKETFSLKELISDYAKSVEYNLVYEVKLDREIDFYGPSQIRAEDMTLFITAAAKDQGYTLLFDKEIKQIEIINSRDIRYRGSQVYTVINEVPKDYTVVQFATNLKHAESSNISRNMRPFMSRYGRVIDEKNANSLILFDTGKNIHRLHTLIQTLDTKEFAQRKLKVEEINKKNKKEIIVQKSILSYIKDEHVLFLITFALIGGIIGFGIRGYLMKRFEGGW